jgi:hypothetical protein
MSAATAKTMTVLGVTDDDMRHLLFGRTGYAYYQRKTTPCR